MRVLQFNIWMEGAEVDDGLRKIVDVIISSNVEVVAMSEVRNYHWKDLHDRLKAALGEKGHVFHGHFLREDSAANDVGLLSKYPISHAEVVAKITSDESSKMVAYHLDAPNLGELGRVVIVTAHLGWKHYALNLPRGYGAGVGTAGFGKLAGGPVTDVERLSEIDKGSNRVAAMDAFVRYTETLERGVPVVLAGDLNEGSDLDWTEQTKDLYDHHGVVMPWHNSRMLRAAGFQDSWRELYSDPVTHLGATWPSAAFGVRPPRPSWCPDADERDRIDFIYHNSVLRTTAAHLVGPTTYIVEGKPLEVCEPFYEPVVPLPWPSDHKALRVVLEIVDAV